jgi:phage terminase large subunit
MALEISSTLKQMEAYKALLFNDYVFFGGGAGGGKSWWLCESRLIKALMFPGYKSFIGREELKRLMGSTYLTWVKVCTFHKVPRSSWKLNGQYNYIEFVNPATGQFDGQGSRIDLLDVKFNPSDPLYERFGSAEYTDGGLEECGEIHFMAFDVLKSRVGRHRNDEFGIRPTLAMTGNPKKNWTHSLFYTPWKKGILQKGYAFIQSLYGDNPHTSEQYEKSLSNIVDPVLKQRLKEGIWDYDEAKGTLFDFDSVNDLFSNTLPKVTDSDKFMTIDTARFGVDKTVLYFWKGFTLYGKEVYNKQSIPITAQRVKDAARRENIPFSHIVADDDGVGGGVVDLCGGIHGFQNNSTPLPNESARYEYLEPQNFTNLKTQCAYIMGQKVKKHEVAIDIPDIDAEFTEYLPQELGQFIIKNPDNDTVKMALIPKDEMKLSLGRSPDYADAFIMRAYFTLKREFTVLTPKEEEEEMWQRFVDETDFDQFEAI